MLNGTEESAVDDWSEFVKITLREEPYSSKLIYSVSLLIVFVGSIVGNILTCVVIYYDKTMHTATNYYLFNLAVSDILATLPILFIVYQLLIVQTEFVEYTYGMFACKFLFCIHYLFVTLLWNNGILVLTVLSIERYIAICYPMMLKGTPKWRRVGKIILAIWTIAILETLPQLWTLDLITTDTALMCFMLPTPTARIITGVLAMITFIVPLGIMVFVYTMIAFKINDKHKSKLRDTVYKNGFKRKNVNKLIALTVSFLVCWLPFFLIRMTIFSTNVDDMLHFYRWFDTAHKIAMFNSWFTTVLNPLLLSLMSMKFRKALKTLWDRKIRKRYSVDVTRRTETVEINL